MVGIKGWRWWDQGGGDAWKSRDGVVWVKGVVESRTGKVKGGGSGRGQGVVESMGGRVKSWGGQGSGGVKGWE